MSDTSTGRVRGVPAAMAPTLAQLPLQQNGRGDLAVAEALPIKTDIVRMGRSYTCTIATGSAFTYVAALPTTRGELVLYNGEASNGAAYVIDSAFMYNVSSMAAAQPMTLVAQLVPSATAPTDDANQLIVSRAGKGNYGGKARKAVANTAMGQIANKWEIIASAQPNMTTNLGCAIYADLYGGWIVPPGGGLALAGVAGTVAGTAIIGVTWHEVVLDLQ